MFRKTRQLAPEDVPTYTVKYISYVIEGFGFKHPLHVRDTLELAKQDVAKYQHVGPTEIEEQLVRVVYQATKTVPCKRSE